MAGFDRAALAEALGDGPVVRVLVAATRGSAPREAGTAMLVGAGRIRGTIGGGTLEHAAIAEARALLTDPAPWGRRRLALPLGPALGQCCGGAVTLLLERFTPADLGALPGPEGTGLLRQIAAGLPPVAPASGAAAGVPAPLLRRLAAGGATGRATGPLLSEGWVAEPPAPAPMPVFLYGAGHVGRALVRVLADLPIAPTWVDTGADRFPDPFPPGVSPCIVASPASAVPRAPDTACHIVMTYSHAFDLDICHAVLSRPFRHLGLIGSDTKAARFRSRLAALGHPADRIARLACPIGDRSLGKAPAAVALGVAAELVRIARQPAHGSAPHPAFRTAEDIA